MYMMQLKQDLENPRTYAFIAAGTFIGIALVMGATYFGYSNLSGMNKNNLNQTNGQSTLPPGTAPVVEDYLKNIDPTKPYVDANGVEHPPLGVAAVPVDPNVKVEHPPVGGPTPEAPKAPAVPKAPAPAAATPASASTTTR